MTTLTYPGVYVVEEPSGVRPIAGASTSIGMFIGRARKGPIGRPLRLANFTEFTRHFGDDNTISDMARYVRMFFLNGGSDTYVMRIADGATRASVTLLAEDGTPVLTLRAKSAGADGETIRARVWYAGEEPEGRFSMEVYRWAPNAAGVLAASDVESYQNLTMNGTDPLYAPDYVSQESTLVDAEDSGDPVADAQTGTSMAGRLIRAQSRAQVQTELAAIIDGTAGQPGGTHFRISVDGLPYVTVDLSAVPAAVAAVSSGTADALLTGTLNPMIAQAVTDAYAAAGSPGIAVDVTIQNGQTVAGDATRFIQIGSQNNGEIRIRTATAGKDLAGPIMFGAAQGGLEIGAHAHRRPAPSGITVSTGTFARWSALAFTAKDTVVDITLPGFDSTGAAVNRTINAPLDAAATGTDPIILDSYAAATSPNGNSDGLRQRLMQIRDAVNADADANPRLNPWRASVAGGRLSFSNTTASDNDMPTITTAPTDLATINAGLPGLNVPRYSVGAGGIAGAQVAAASVASDGSVPQVSDYEDAFAVIDEEVRLFNLMVLPPDRETAQDMQPIHGSASAYCRSRRAMLFVDPPGNATDAQTMSTEVNTVRTGVARDYAALFFPRIIINEDGREIAIGAAGAMAGLAARTDATRGVWKAPAGQDLPLFGVTGVAMELSNAQVGILNPRGVNCITRASSGIRPWGSRTLDGDDDFASEWKYIPVRRTALFIEESLHNGLQWVVFEPNGEVLWSQMRLNVGAFMHRLFRQGAFKGEKKTDAYFVKCDAETTTQADIDLGVVNIWVGFAPLKPAEFVVIHLQQIAGQIEV